MSRRHDSTTGAPSETATQVAASGERSVALGGSLINSTVITGTVVQLFSNLGPRVRVVLGVGGLALAVVLAAAVMQIVRIVAPPPPAPPPPPTLPKLTGDLNIAVAGFEVVDAQQKPIASADDGGLADSFERSLQDAVTAQRQAQLNAGINPFDIQVGSGAPVMGLAPEERTRSAAQVADEVRAHILIYGRLTQDSRSTVLQPELFVNLSKVTDAEELVGEYPLTDPIVVKGPLEDPFTRRSLREALAPRTEALSNFIFGLSEYTHGQFDESLRDFRTAESHWPTEDRRQVLFLFMGNAALRNHQIDESENYYQMALRDDQGYARALVGLAEARFQRIAAAGCAANHTDVNALRQLIADYAAISNAADQPPLSSIPAKSAFGIGRASVCLTMATGEDHFPEARQQFAVVIANYSSGNTRAQALASESYASLALMAWPRSCDPGRDDAYRRAAEAFNQAIQLSDDQQRQAEFFRWLGVIHTRLGEGDQADADYQRSVELDPTIAAIVDSSRKEPVPACTASA